MMRSRMTRSSGKPQPGGYRNERAGTAAIASGDAAVFLIFKGELTFG